MSAENAQKKSKERQKVYVPPKVCRSGTSIVSLSHHILKEPESGKAVRSDDVDVEKFKAKLQSHVSHDDDDNKDAGEKY